MFIEVLNYYCIIDSIKSFGEISKPVLMYRPKETWSYRSAQVWFYVRGTRCNSTLAGNHKSLDIHVTYNHFDENHVSQFNEFVAYNTAENYFNNSLNYPLHLITSGQGGPGNCFVINPF